MRKGLERGTPVAPEIIGSARRIKIGQVVLLVAYDDILHRGEPNDGQVEFFNLKIQDPGMTLRSYMLPDESDFRVISEIQTEHNWLPPEHFFEEYDDSLMAVHGDGLVTAASPFPRVRSIHERDSERPITTIDYFSQGDGDVIRFDNSYARADMPVLGGGPASTYTFSPAPESLIKSQWGGKARFMAHHLAAATAALMTMSQLYSGDPAKRADFFLSSEGTFVLNGGQYVLVGNGGYNLHQVPEGQRYSSSVRVQKSGVAKPEVTEVNGGGRNQKEPSWERDGEEHTEKVRLEDFAGLPEIVAELKFAARSFAEPDIMEKYGAERSTGIVLSGPGGTGKTMLARGFANEIPGSELKEIRASELINKYIGESQKNVDRLFDELEQAEVPTIVLLDEMDSILSGEGSRPTSEVASMVATFKSRLSRSSEKNKNVIFIGTTNDTSKMDEEMLRAGRFDLKIEVPLPNEEARYQIWTNLLAKDIALRSKVYDDDIDIQALATITDGKSGADITEVLRRAKIHCAKEDFRTGQTQRISQSLLVTLVEAYDR